MTALTYDDLKNFEQAGFTPMQVKVLASATSEIASKSEIARVEKELSDKIEKTETRLEKRMDERFDLVDKRFTALEQVMNDRFAGVDRRFAGIEKQLNSLSSLLKWLIATAVALIPTMTTWFTWVSHLSLK